MQKPPLGVMPRKIHEEKRFYDLQRAIADYTEASLEVNTEWIEEYNYLRKRLFEK